ncbi:MAG TPA: Lrp/AsnC family transcriptional regulator [Amaricoccus sp.]|uniref:Lrp/AsnC family transcriptional regulator n=1 Tax=Amaricoccus sp. TaxID=1872485 RepID=UPI002C950312|nr:Lrp/AsnC family transcriptional regulator [Amaricoccus sp.]HMQ93771.1 Lrp/AsnC family transcriptional regulator [Amaricoccus sp.]HMR54475.1 Lrp/AsnC family transcriptional regulator [Amaricoccus sp.]HMR61043.1 Lrp/AsnC family transcriptional regulator [Amaricoccus sp.]HMU01500.1 Lrp/AsnC family transcriptional regulator [Amaricoccus sp.]
MSRPLDDRDLQILTVLSREGRITKAELARRINLSATPAWERMKRLEAEGYIEGYRAEVALARIAPHVTVFVTVELDNHRAETFRSFEQAIARHEEIQAAWAIGGGYDYLLKVVSRDIDSYQRLIDALLAERIGLRRYFTYVVTKDVKTASAPPFEALIEAADPET